MVVPRTRAALSLTEPMASQAGVPTSHLYLSFAVLTNVALGRGRLRLRRWGTMASAVAIGRWQLHGALEKPLS